MVGGKGKLCTLGGGRSCAQGKWAGWRLWKNSKDMLCCPQPQTVVTKSSESPRGQDVAVGQELQLS